MSSLIPIATYNLNLQPFQPAAAIELEYPSTIRITSIALDPEAVDEHDKPSTVRMLKRKLPFVDDEFEDDEDDEDDEDELDEDEEEEEDDEEEEPKKAKKDAAEDEDEEDDEDDEEEEFDDEDTEEYVICTLSPKFQYQQAVDITIQPDEEVYFIVTGSYPIHLAGNYVDHPDDEDSEDDEYDEEYDDDEYDLTPDEDEIYDLDDLEDASDIENKIEELVEEDSRNKKRSIDEPQDEESEPEQETPKSKKAKKDKKDKKNVKFSAELEQGPTGSDFKDQKPEATKKDQKKKDTKKEEPKKSEPKQDGAKKFPTKTLLGGVITEDRKVGKGQTAKSGNRVSIRYIGKLKNGKVFDKNTSGKPFAFGLGKGECIKGFDLGVAGMAVGGERRVVIPAKMGYGSQALPGIPANSELTFDIKLVSLK